MKIDPNELNAKKAHDILTDIVMPRPIAFVSTIGEDGIYNAAPYSYFTAISHRPMIVGFSLSRKKKGTKKDTLVNIESTKEYGVNMVSEELAISMNKAAAAYPPHVDEFEKADLTPIKADIIQAPLIKESPVNMECRLIQILEFGDEPEYTNFVIGEVVRIHINEEYTHDGQIQPKELKLIGRLGGGGSAYCRTTDIFNIKRISLHTTKTASSKQGS
jgi:flavin reductase (DIM6/NTAB) family NADH-FMN oxidoreductase RutF